MHQLFPEIISEDMGRTLATALVLKIDFLVSHKLMKTAKEKVASIRPLLKIGVFVTNVHTKTGKLNKYFAEQYYTIATGSFPSLFVPKCSSIREDINIDRRKILHLIHALDSIKANGCNSISVSMIKIYDMSIVEPLCLIFENFLETGTYPSIWKKANVIPMHKKGIEKIP